jgi:glycosyltransferase involved in cell wall biosynthesis
VGVRGAYVVASLRRGGWYDDVDFTKRIGTNSVAQIMGIESTKNGASKPLVTVGLPVFNGERYIQRAVESGLNQTLPDWELILSDNASTDNTGSICRELATRDRRIRYVRKETNIGPGANFMSVLREARTKYFSWLAHDDYFASNDRLEKLVARAEEGRFALVSADVQIMRQTASGVELITTLRPSTFFDGITNRFRLNRAMILHYGVSHQLYGLFNLELITDLEEIFLSVPRLPCFGDGIILHKIITTCDLAYVAGAPLAYVTHPKQASATIPTPELLRAFVQYSRRVFAVYQGVHDYTAIQKLELLTLLGGIHGRYAAYLAAAATKQKLLRWIRGENAAQA